MEHKDLIIIRLVKAYDSAAVIHKKGIEDAVNLIMAQGREIERLRNAQDKREGLQEDTGSARVRSEGGLHANGIYSAYINGE